MFAVVIAFGIGAMLTPHQKEELVRAEHLVEEKVDEWINNHPPKRFTRSSQEKSETKEDNRVPPPPPKIEPIPEHLPEKDPTAEKIPEKDIDNGAAKQSMRWVDGEMALKRKLQVLYDMQKKGDNLGVPVLTRYLGEDFPAFVGTPDSTMKKEEFEKLVEAKYEEMRKEEEEFQKKMTLQIEKDTKERRNMGITTP